jgi:MFS family permease
MSRFPTMRWLNRTVLGIGLASLVSDWSHEIATTLMPAFLASMGVAAAWLGLIEGVSDGLSSFAKMGSGYYTDKLPRRKSTAVLGYLITAFGTAAIGLATTAWHVLLARSAAWLGRGVRTSCAKGAASGSGHPRDIRTRLWLRAHAGHVRCDCWSRHRILAAGCL